MECRGNRKRGGWNRCGCPIRISVAVSLKYRGGQLFEEKRHAVGALDDLGDHLIRERHRVADEPPNQLIALGLSQAPQGYCRHMGLAGPRRLIFRPEGRDEQHREALDLVNGEIKQLTGARVSPMQILDNHQHRVGARQSGELSQQGLERFLLLPLRREVESRIASVDRQ